MSCPPISSRSHQESPRVLSRRIQFVQSRRRRSSLGPAGAVPNKGVGRSDVVHGVVVVLADMLHQRALDERVCLIGSALGSVVAHEHDEGIVQLPDLLQVIDHSANIGVNALECC